MMENLFVSYLCLSAVLTVTALALSLTTHLAKRFASPHLTYGLMLAVMIIMLIPFRFELPEIPKAIAVTSPATYGEYTQANPILVGGEGFEAPLRSLSVSKYTGILSVIWASVAVTKLILHIVSYLAFVKKVKKSSYKADCPQLLLYTERVFEVRISGVIRTPFTTGVFRPILLLPESIQGTEKLKYVLAHEAVHINRHDMLFKWLTVTAKCIHWFNPFMYFVCRQLDDACEISCDASVTKNMDSPSKLDYMSTIIDLACAEGMKISRLTTALSSQGK